MSRYVARYVHGKRTIDRAHPFRRKRGAHRREHTIEVRLAHEQNSLTRQMHHEIASRVRSAQKERVHLDASDVDDFAVARHGLRWNDDDAWSHTGSSGRGRGAGRVA